MRGDMFGALNQTIPSLASGLVWAYFELPCAW
jgi:hypothetical protein